MRLLVTIALSFTAVLSVGCGDDERRVLVDLKTDYLSGFEFTTVRTTLHASIADLAGPPLDRAESAAFEGEAFVSGRRIAEFSTDRVGATVIETVLLRPDGSTIASRVSRVSISGPNTGVTVLVSRSCEGVVCPEGGAPDATECFGGRCVRPDCVEENVEACGPLACTSATSCTVPVACADPACVAGSCLFEAVPARCASGEYCDLELGCTAETMPDTGVDAASDASTDAPDASLDAPDGGTATYVLEGVSYVVPSHLVVELEVPSAELAGLLDVNFARDFASPHPGSAFPPGLYYAVGRPAPELPSVFRISGGTVELFAQAAAEPTRNFNGAVFTPPSSAFGDYLYLCSIEGGPLDGLFRMDPSGTVERFSGVGACYGIDFDTLSQLDDEPALYVIQVDESIARVTSTGAVRVLDTSSPDFNDANVVVIPVAGAFAGSLLVSTSGDWDVVGDGFLGRTAGGAAWPPLARIVDRVDVYGSAVTSGPPFGDAWLTSFDTEVRAYRPDTSYTVLVSGDVRPSNLHLSKDGATLWVQSGGQLVRLRQR